MRSTPSAFRPRVSRPPLVVVLPTLGLAEPSFTLRSCGNPPAQPSVTGEQALAPFGPVFTALIVSSQLDDTRLTAAAKTASIQQ
jgi:hypothetical protein